MKRWFLLTLALVLLLTACGGKTVPPPPEEENAPPADAPPPMPEAPAKPVDPEEAALQALLNGLSLEEKVGQLFFVKVPAENALEDVTAYHLGGYLLFSKDTKDLTANELIQKIASWQAETADSGIPLLIGADEEGGTTARISSNPHIRSKRFSSPGKLWRQGELEAVKEEAREKAILLKAIGVNVNLAPVADVSTNPADFMYDRTTGGDETTAAAFVGAVLEVQTRYGLGSVLKHFPGYGNNRDTHNGAAVDERSLDTFWNQDFVPFQSGIDFGNRHPLGPAVLVSHNIVKCMDPDLPASLSPEVHRVLRDELGFDGVVMTDDLAMGAVSAYAADGNAAVMSLQAGNDLVVTTDYRAQIPRVIAAVEEGELPESVIDTACLRVLRWKLELGLLELTEEGKLVSTVIPWG